MDTLWIVLLLGILLIGVFYVISRNVHRLEKRQEESRQDILDRGVTAMATVKGLKSFHGDMRGYKMGGTSYILEYTVQGKVYTFYSINSTNDPLLKKEDKVEIKYLPENPKKRVVVNEDILWRK